MLFDEVCFVPISLSCASTFDVCWHFVSVLFGITVHWSCTDKSEFSLSSSQWLLGDEMENGSDDRPL